ncbi:sensor of ECF-type sigma factor [Flavobacterium aciduliphilum]|uniref:LTXXQ motif family protein n=1 Tax=Flavobacterium aciduliphilum TaxID=1101402 RepID=A0A328Y7R2_9FLAO|nr:sensor of ECF-type sigma factor [Flavobacterium aciduliphilum]RAR70078.1 hypothetical protein CLV55_11367 [Flavobacterium aciduliphilum]
MKKTILLSVSFLFFTLLSTAQIGPLRERFKEKKEQIKALKIAFITEELQLTPDEATKFWPVFNAFEDKQQEIRKQKIKAFLNRKDDRLDNLSEKDAATLLVQMESTEDELYQLKKKFISNLKGILPAVKILKLKRAEEEFSKKLLQQYRDRKIGR